MEIPPHYHHLRVSTVLYHSYLDATPSSEIIVSYKTPHVQNPTVWLYKYLPISVTSRTHSLNSPLTLLSPSLLPQRRTRNYPIHPYRSQLHLPVRQFTQAQHAMHNNLHTQSATYSHAQHLLQKERKKRKEKERKGEGEGKGAKGGEYRVVFLKLTPSHPYHAHIRNPQNELPISQRQGVA